MGSKIVPHPMGEAVGTFRQASGAEATRNFVSRFELHPSPELEY
jgi:hypothetical protein